MKNMPIVIVLLLIIGLVTNSVAYVNLVDAGPSYRSFAPTSVVAGSTGQSFEIQCAITNSGDETSGSFYVYFYASTNTTITNSDNLLGYVALPSIDAGETLPCTLSTTFPTGIYAGTYYVGWVINSNSTAYVTGQVLSVLPGAPTTAPYASEPSNGKTGVGLFPTLSWYSISSATTYNVQVAENASFTSATDITGLSSTNTTLTDLTIGTTYYWRVNGENVVGTGPWSSYRYFTTAALDLADGGEGTNTFAPTSVYAGQSLAVACQVTNTGVQSSGSFYVRFYLSLDTVITTSDRYLGQTTVSSIPANSTGDAAWSGMLSSSVPFGVYYVGWIIDYSNNVGETDELNNTGYNKSSRLTVVAPPPPTPILSSPSNNATLITLSPTLIWRVATGASTYNVQIATDSGFTEPVLNATGLTTVWTTTPALTNTTSYHWRVSAANANGASDWSIPWQFSIRAPANSPSLVSIADAQASVGVPFNMILVATDPDQGDILTYSLPQAPTGMTVNSVNGLLQWVPVAADVGIHDVIAKVSDATGNTDTDTFTITVDDGTDVRRLRSNKLHVFSSLVATPNPATTAQQSVFFTVPGYGLVKGSLSIYNSVGKRVYQQGYTIGNGGSNVATQVGSWNLRDNKGEVVPNGTYIAVLKVTGATGATKTYTTKVGVTD